MDELQSFSKKSFLSPVFHLVFVASLLNISAAFPDDQWLTWKGTYSRVYSSTAEEERAYQIWTRNRDFVRSHNGKGLSFTVELNDFADKERHPTLPPRSKVEVNKRPQGVEWAARQARQLPPPESWDWRDEGVVTPVKTGASKGWSDVIAATEAIEAMHAIKTKGKAEALSWAKMEDCCTGHNMQIVQPFTYECLARAGGPCKLEDYPQPTGQCNNTCKAVSTTDSARTYHVKSGDEGEVLKMLLQRPLAVLVDASPVSFDLYSGGIYDEIDCIGPGIHGMLLVGYGYEDMKAGTGPYWILKNSAGTGWGEGGYMRMRRGVNRCQVARDAFFPTSGQ